jgi:hypothetical protein
MFAAIGNHPHVVNELLNSGASLSLTNINGHSALALAVKNVSFFPLVDATNKCKGCSKRSHYLV